MIHRLILASLAILTLGLAAAPAADATPPGYFYLAPYHTIRLTHDTCTVDYVHGTYGNVAFARVTVVTPNTCSAETGTLAQAWGDESTFCQFYSEQIFNYSDCDITNAGRTIQAVAVGPLIASFVRIDRPGSTMAGYGDIWFSPIA